MSNKKINLCDRERFSAFKISVTAHTHTDLCYLCESSLRVSGDEQLVALFQVSHLHVNVEPGDGSLRTQTPLKFLWWTENKRKLWIHSLLCRTAFSSLKSQIVLLFLISYHLTINQFTSFYLHNNDFHTENLIFSAGLVCNVGKLVDFGWIHLLGEAETQGAS